MSGEPADARRAAVTTIRVKVKPGSRQSTLTQSADGDWIAHVKSSPVDGRANRELIELVAATFSCKRSDVSIKSGAAARLKLVAIDARDRT